MKTLFTDAGLQKLGEIVRQARGCRSYRDFESVTGVSHATIRRLETGEVKNPNDSTLEAIAPQTPYTLEELKAIATERPVGTVRSFLIAEDILPMVEELPDIEKARLGQMIIAKLARMEVFLGETPPTDGLMLQVQLMSYRQMSDLLKVIAERLK